MKINIFLIIIIFNVSLYSQDIQGVFTYKKDFSDFSLSTSKNDSLIKFKMNNLLKVLVENGSSVDFILKANKKESLFFVNDILTKDNDKSKKYAIGIGDTKGVFYVNLDSKEILNKKESYGQLFLVKSSLNDKLWNITNESKKIGNYNCFKATSEKIVENSKGTFKHHIEAWFTTEIPLNFGPAGYGGLPGLIIELKFQNIRFYLTKIELKRQNEVNVKKPMKGKLVTIKEFNKIGKEITKSFRRN
tara:strand:+ start:4865 stop:5602 length:738 start_codon:yes stop_codon:yes gene_type:complete